MKISDLSSSEFRSYFETRLPGRISKSGSQFMARCIFHDDRHASMSLNFEHGVFNCHGCKFAGGLIDFEKKFSSCDDQAAIANIADIVGHKQIHLAQRPEVTYDYKDEFGKLIFQVVRYPDKRFTQRKPDGKNGWEYKTSDCRVVLYRLPQLVGATHVLICEGEKDCDNLQHVLPAHVAATTSPRGAGKWREEFAPYFTGKVAVIIADNDEPGRKHAQQVALSVCRYAAGVKVVEDLPVPEKGDVSDYLSTHTFEELKAHIQKTPQWRAPQPIKALFIPASEFRKQSPREIDWMLEGIIQRGSNGMIIAPPKSAKSFLAIDLAVALASGQRWLDFYIPRRVRVAVVSREDNPQITSHRLQKILEGRDLDGAITDGFLYLNSKAQSPELMLDNPEQMAELIDNLKKLQSEFLILDVFRVLHSAEENDNTEMQKVIRQVNDISTETGCSVALIHHENKQQSATLTERARGASAIAGWAEWIMGISVVDDQEWVRQLEAETKSAMAPAPVYFKIEDAPAPFKGISLHRVEGYQHKSKRRIRPAQES